MVGLEEEREAELRVLQLVEEAWIPRAGAQPR